MTDKLHRDNEQIYLRLQEIHKGRHRFKSKEPLICAESPRWQSPLSQKGGQASLHFPGKLREAKRIDRENVKMANRIIGSKPILATKEQCSIEFNESHSKRLDMLSAKKNKGFQMKTLVERQ